MCFGFRATRTMLGAIVHPPCANCRNKSNTTDVGGYHRGENSLTHVSALRNHLTPLMIRNTFVFIPLLLLAGCITPPSQTHTEADLKMARERAFIIEQFHDKEVAAQKRNEARGLFDDVDEISATEKRSPDYVPPVHIHRAVPVYSWDLRKRGTQGIVWMLFVVDKEGSVRRAEALSGSTPEFIGPAKKAILRWKFTPATYKGRPISVQLMMPLMFVLNDPPEKGQSSKELPQ